MFIFYWRPMRSVISTTFDDKYLFYLPITTWCWNKLGVDVICFLPIKEFNESSKEYAKSKLVFDSINDTWDDSKNEYDSNFTVCHFKCPEHKEATYAQCSRLYAAALDLPEDEILITSDVDMAVFSDYLTKDTNSLIHIYGHDLVPENQFPMCYLKAHVSTWRSFMKINGRSYQKCLDDLVGIIECQDFRGCQWSLDQDNAFQHIVGDKSTSKHCHHRARPGTQFAANRVDRDDQNWRSYCGPDLIDAHLWRPGYTDKNFANILELLQTQYPMDSFDWLISYREQYIRLL